MKHARKWLACLLAGVLALAVLAGCSALMGGTVQKDTEQAKALMKEVDPSLTYNTDLEDAASRLADWLVEDSTQLTTQSGLYGRLTLDGAKLGTGTRRWPERWLTQVETAGHGEDERETIAPSAQLTELLMMGLRLVDGITIAHTS